MSLPIVAIVGRPNVGKSSLLNCIAGKRISIVDPTPGVTRDRVSTPVALPISEADSGEVRTDDSDAAEGFAAGEAHAGFAEKVRYIELVDTGGVGIVDVDKLTDDVEGQINFAIDSAAVVLFIVDAREGVTPLDRHVAEKLRKAGKKVILVANKVDLAGTMTEGELARLGFGGPMLVSAEHNRNIRELLVAISDAVGSAAPGAIPHSVMKLAIVGKRNAGKSSFINALAGENRVIVSEVPGTTRDSVDVTVQIDGRDFTIIDTAGVRKRRSIEPGLEFLTHHRSMRSIRRADVVALMIDASVPVSQVDKELAGEIAELFKPVVLVVNKWDLAAGKAAGEDYQEYFEKVFPELSYAPISLTSAINNQNIRRTIKLAEQLFDQASTRVSTPKINEIIKEVLALRGPSHKTGTKPPKILYASQIDILPPTIICFVNDVRSFDQSYQRFLLNQLRERLPYSEVPIRLFFRQRKPGEHFEAKVLKPHIRSEQRNERNTQRNDKA